MEKKIIIPNYVALRTEESKLNGFYLSRKLDYFKDVKNTNELLTYTVKKEKIDDGERGYDFKNSYYTVNNGIWTYRLKKSGLTLAFQYDYENKILKFSNGYDLLPFRVNITHAIGEILADVISLDLLMKNIFLINGVAFRKNGKVHVFCAPSLNGKSTFIKKNKGNIDIISDDYVLLDFNKNVVSVTPLIDNSSKVDDVTFPIETIDFFINSTHENTHPKSYAVKDFLKLISTHHDENIFTKNLVFYYGLGEVYDRVLEQLNHVNFIKIHNTHNYDYEKYLRS